MSCLDMSADVLASVVGPVSRTPDRVDPIAHAGRRTPDRVDPIDPAGRRLLAADATVERTDPGPPSRRALAAVTVAVRAAERRRLQRDLHDGLGPTLAATAMQAEAALDLVGSDPDAARRAIAVAAAQAKAALAEIRRLVRTLRPITLDQQELPAAIRARVRAFELAAGTPRRPGFTVDVSVDGGLRPLPATVEVAALAIVVEAVANAARHSMATRCQVRLRRCAALHVEVDDNGVGVADDAVTGVGLASMWDRAAELGGGCVIEPGPDGGTSVRAWLPLPTAPW